MKKTGISFSFDKDVIDFFSCFGDKLDKARMDVVDAAGVVWADSAKLITQADQHIDTGAYVNSIGYATNFSGPNGSEVGKVIHDVQDEKTSTILTLGSGVDYAESLEKKFNIFARALDESQDDITKVSTAIVKKTLGG